MLGDLFAIIAPVFICAGIGFIWARQGRPYDVDLVTALMTNIGTPCLVFYTLSDAELSPDAFASMALLATTTILVFALIAGTVLKLINSDVRAFLPSLIFSNSGNMGLPLCLLAFGEKGLAIAIVFFTVSAVAQFTIGMMISSGSMSIVGLARIPIIYAVIAAVALMVAQIEAPAVIVNTTRILGGMTIPMMLITLGVSLSRLRVAALPRSTLLSLFRLLMGFAVGVGLSEILGLEGLERGVLIVQSSMPVAVFNYLFAQRYKREPEEVAGMVVISTAISFATLPLLLWYVL
jgi:malate permease and related proteins